MDAMARRWVFTLDAGWVWVVVALLVFWGAVALLLWLVLSD
jgi:hypothetical protein